VSKTRRVTRVVVSAAALTLVSATTTACASHESRAAAKTSASTRPRLQPAVHEHLALVDATRSAVDPIGVRSAPTRALPTELYLPAARGPVPLIVFAHGYDGDPSKFSELFQHWSDAGFAVAAPQFPISFTGAATGPLARAADYLNQPRDLTFVLDQVLHSRWAARLDPHHIGAAGLSLGGVTIWGLVANTCCRDARISAAIVMDGNRFDFTHGHYVANRIPVLVYHADHDYALPFANARAAYEHAVAPKYFVTISGAFHAEPYENIPNVADAMVVASSTQFWRTYLLDDAAARGRITRTATVPGISTAESVLTR
jgi:predicted dienelactone hydrolase